MKVKRIIGDSILIFPFNITTCKTFVVCFSFQGHIAIAYYESTHESEKKITVITQNVDGLHVRAGTKNLIELHGNLYKTRCTKCKEVLVNNDSPICEVCFRMADILFPVHRNS